MLPARAMLTGVTIRPQVASDLTDVDLLSARTFGPGRYTRSAYRLREGVDPDPLLSFVACVGPLLVGSIIMTAIRIGDCPALLLGPLTVEPAFRSGGIGEALMTRSLSAAERDGHSLVLLVGDLPYYGRVGFSRVPDGRLEFCGPVDPERLLYRDLVPGALHAVGRRVRRAASA